MYVSRELKCIILFLENSPIIQFATMNLTWIYTHTKVYWHVSVLESSVMLMAIQIFIVVESIICAHYFKYLPFLAWCWTNEILFHANTPAKSALFFNKNKTIYILYKRNEILYFNLKHSILIRQLVMQIYWRQCYKQPMCAETILPIKLKQTNKKTNKWREKQ